MKVVADLSSDNIEKLQKCLLVLTERRTRNEMISFG